MADIIEEGVGSTIKDAIDDDLMEKLEHHGEALAGFFNNVQQNVLGAISAQSVGPQGLVENVQGMRMAFVSYSRLLDVCGDGVAVLVSMPVDKVQT